MQNVGSERSWYTLLDNSGASPKTNRSVAIGAGVPAGLLALAAILSLIVLLALRARKKV